MFLEYPLVSALPKSILKHHKSFALAVKDRNGWADFETQDLQKNIKALFKKSK